MFTQLSRTHSLRFLISNRKLVLSLLAVVSLGAVISLSLRLVQSAPAGPASPPLLQPPTVTLNVPSEVLIGEDFEFEVKFDNTLGSDTGYAPYIDLYLPASGVDQNGGGRKCDGISFISAQALFNSPPTVALAPAYDSGIGGVPPCPFSYGTTHPFSDGTVTGSTVLALAPQHQLVVLALPFGSFDDTQPEITVRVKAHVSDFADLGTPLTIFARGGFRYGMTPIAEAGDPVMESTPVSLPTTPTLFRLNKKYLGPEDEAVSGPNFVPYYPLKYELTADIADGQIIKNLVLTDNVPANMQFAGNVQVSIQGNPAISVMTCSGTDPLEVVIASPSLILPDGTLSVTLCGDVTGSPSPADVGVSFNFYIPDVDANGQIIINKHCSNAPVDVKNDILATGKWDPLDPRDAPTVNVVSNLTNVDHLLKAKCLAIQKSVQVSQEWPDGAIGPTPGDILEYKLQFQVSDYFTIGQLVVTDFLADGQALASTPATFTVTDQFGTTGSPSTTFPAVSVTTIPDSPVPGFCPISFQNPQIGTILRFDVSSAMANLPSTVSRHGAGILTGGYAAGTPPGGFATGTIVFYATIKDTFKSPPVSMLRQFVDKHDPMNNCVKIEGAVYDNVSRPSPVNAPFNIPTVVLGSSMDASAVQSIIVSDTLKKTVYAVKRNTVFVCGETATACLNFPASQEIRPGDEVTFRIEKTIPSSDAEDLSIEDWLPLPILDVAGFTTSSFIGSCLTSPAPGTICYLLPTDTLTGFLSPAPVFSLPTGTNSIKLDYQTFNFTDNKARKIDLLFTSTVTNLPFADNLFLTNEVRERESGTFAGPFDQVAIQQVNLREPNLRIRKGVIATDNPHGLFTQPIPGPSPSPTPAIATAQAPAGVTFGLTGFTGTINSTNLLGLMDSDLLNVDANDLVTFAITIENQGGHPAFDVKLDDIFPTDCFTFDPNTIQVKLGSGAPVTPVITGNFSLAFPAPIAGLDANTTPGDNIVVVTFQAKVKADITPGCCRNTAKITKYASIAGGPDFVAAGFNGPYEDTADVCTKPTLTKSVVFTSEAHTGPDNSTSGTPEVTIGEIVRYRLEVRLPEGSSSPNFQVTDALPAGMKFLDGGTTRVAFVSNGAGITHAGFFNTTFDIPGNAPPPSSTLNTLPAVSTVPPGAITGGTACGAPVMFNLGNVQNNDNDLDLEYVVIEFNALVCNEAGNTDPTTRSNTFSVSVNNSTIIGSPAINVIVREPNLTITKSVSPTTVVQGVSPTYTVTITNPSLLKAFEVQFADTLPAGLILDPGSVNFSGSCTSPALVNTIPSLKCGEISAGGVVTITYKALALPDTCPITLTNNARVTWTSLPGPNGTTSNSTMSSTPGASGAADGERDGSSPALNDYLANASAPLTVVCPPCTKAPPDMVAWWPLDEPNGSTVVNDFAEFNNQGSPKTGTSLGSLNAPNSVLGLVSGAVSFNSNQQTNGPHIEVSSHPEINFGSGNLSIDTWVFVPPPPFVFIHPIVDKLDVNPAGTQGTGYAFYLVSSFSSGARLQFDMGTNGPLASYISAGPSVPFNTWTHVAVTVNRTGAVTFYVNGAPVIPAGPAVPTGSLDNTLPLLMGESRLPGLSQAAITLDEVEMFKRVLGQSEIQNIYNARSAGKCKCPLITLNPAAGALPATLINMPYSITFTATGGCSSLFTYSVTGGALPPGLTLSPGGVLSGTPKQQGNFTFTVTATDSCGCSKSQTYMLTVDCPMVPLPLFNTGVADNGSLLPAGVTDPHYVLQPGAPVSPPDIVLDQSQIPGVYVPNGPNSQWIGPNVNPLSNSPAGDYRYVVTFNMPAGADLSTAIIAGQWTSDNEAEIFLNGLPTFQTTGHAAFGSFTPFFITGPGNFTSTVNTLEFRVHNSELQTGLRVEMTGSVKCCPQPTTGTVIVRKNTVGGNDTFGYMTGGAGLNAFTITTSGGTASRIFSNITPGPKTVTESPLPSGWVFTSLACSDPDGGTTVTGQTANIDLDANETVMCTYTNTKCPPITLNPAAGSLTSAIINAPYSQAFIATGGCSSSFTYSVTSGALPPGLTLSTNGVLSGTATQLGNSTFTVTATDSCGCSQSQVYTLKVENLRFGTSGIKISEFRFDGPNGTGDEFVELVNNTSTPKTITSTIVGDLGWSVWGFVIGAPQKICTIPNGTILEPGQHFLCAKIPGYELGNYATPDDNINNHTAFGLDADGGVALFSATAVVIGPDGTWSGLGPVFREDAVGFRKKNSDTFPLSSAPAFREGDGLFPIGPQDPIGRTGKNPDDLREYSFVRKHVTAGNGAWSGPVYQDTNDNIVDWVLVSNIGDLIVNSAFVGTPTLNFFPGSIFDPSPFGFPGSEAATVPVFGAPGPQNLASPLERNYGTQFIRSLLDSGSAPDVSPNRERNSQIVCGGPRGDLILRFTYKNQTGLVQTNLRVRWIDLSTINRNNPNFTAILDLLDATAATRKLFVNAGRDLNTGTSAAAIAAQNDPPVAPGDGSGGNPANDGIVNARPAGGAGEKTVRGTYVEGVDKTPQVFRAMANPPPGFGVTPLIPGFGSAIQSLRQVNPTWLNLDQVPGIPCRVGGFNSATVAFPPAPSSSPNLTTIALPAPLPIGGSISLEHRFGVIRQGSFLIIGIIESN